MTQVPGAHGFASDNTAGICPEALAALTDANSGAVAAYGEDRLTAEVCDRVRSIFDTDCDVYFVFNGTAANSLAIAQLCRSYQSVICHRLAHIQTDECGGPEFFSGGSKLLTIDGDKGKISVPLVRAVMDEQYGVHSHQPRLISVTETTELGTVYSPDEIAELCRFARSSGLLLHMDGARFANAVASLGCRPNELTWKAGVDVLCFGGTKNGISAGELVVFFNRERARGFDYRLKQAGQLASKLRFLAAQWNGLLAGDVWLRNASHANAAANNLARQIEIHTGLELILPVESNAVFLRLSAAQAQRLSARGWSFYKMVEPDIYRLMCSWATTEQEIQGLVSALEDCE
jgi:threonine aldolase